MDTMPPDIKRKKKHKRIRKTAISFGAFLIMGVGYSSVTNPYGVLALVDAPFTMFMSTTGDLILNQTNAVRYIDTPSLGIFSPFQWFQTSFRVAENAYLPGDAPLKGNVDKIIQQLHTERFDVTKPYIITDGHYAQLFGRNMGIFYNATLDPRFGFSEDDWMAREQSTSETIALHLELVKKAGKEYTTFFPLWGNTYSGANLYAPPSDSLFSLFYTLNAMTDPHFIDSIFPAKSDTVYTLHTTDTGDQLMSQYGSTLTTLTNTYLQDSIDPQTGLIRKDILLSSARDGIKRQSSFYDNVIAWSTAKLATKLGLSINCPVILQKDGVCDFDSWKQKIISAFWDNKTGIFLNDLSDDSIQNHVYSADAFIVTSTQFLDLKNPSDRDKLEREIKYIQNNKLDKPFPLRYAIKDEPSQLYGPVRNFIPSYMGNTIWSHWGMEYAKALILLSDYEPQYLPEAKQVVDAYTANIRTFGGYPELYDASGKLYETKFYRSLLHTGWVVNYEEARMMLVGRT